MQHNPERVTQPGVTTEEGTISVVKEQLHLSTREVVTGEVQVRKQIRTESVDVPLTTVHTAYREERVPVNRVVDIMPEPRYEGKNLIVPVVREQQVVITQLVLVEEIHLIQESRSEERTERIELHTEEATVTRVPLKENSTPPLPN